MWLWVNLYLAGQGSIRGAGPPSASECSRGNHSDKHVQLQKFSSIYSIKFSSKMGQFALKLVSFPKKEIKKKLFGDLLKMLSFQAVQTPLRVFLAPLSLNILVAWNLRDWRFHCGHRPWPATAEVSVNVAAHFIEHRIRPWMNNMHMPVLKGKASIPISPVF